MGMDIIEIENKKVLVLDSSIKHSERCKCRNCRSNKTAPKAKFLIPLEIKKYFPVFIINPFISFIFISKLFEAINSDYLNFSFEANSMSINQDVYNILKDSFSKNFLDCINLMINRDIFNAVGYFEENIDKLDEFEMLYLSGLINFYIQNLDKSYDNFSQAFEKLTNLTLENYDFEDDLNLDYPYLFFLFDSLIISLYSKKYETFNKVFRYLINQDNEFSFYIFMLFVYLFFYVYDSYILIENVPLIISRIDNIIKNIKEFNDSNKIIAYIIYILMCISVYRVDIYNILKIDIDKIISTLDSEIKELENYYDVLKKCNNMDPDNILYKIALYNVNKNEYNDIINSLEFLPLNKVIKNFLEYVKFLESIITKLIYIDKDIEINLTKIKQLVEDEPNNPFFWIINGLYSLSNRDIDIANNYFRGAVATDNSFTEARILFSITSFLSGDIDKAEKILENSLNTYSSYLYDIVLINLLIIQKIQKKDNFMKEIINELSNIESIEIMQNILKEINL